MFLTTYSFLRERVRGGGGVVCDVEKRTSVSLSFQSSRVSLIVVRTIKELSDYLFMRSASNDFIPETGTIIQSAISTVRNFLDKRTSNVRHAV